MPLYDFKCAQCEHVWEEKLAMKDYDLPTKSPCPSCKVEQGVEQVISGRQPFIDPIRLGIKKAPADFQKYVLGRIQHSVPNNVMGKNRSIVKEI